MNGVVRVGLLQVVGEQSVELVKSLVLDEQPHPVVLQLLVRGAQTATEVVSLNETVYYF